MSHQCTGPLCSLSLRAPYTNTRIQQDKDMVMDKMDLDFSFEDVDLGWHFKSFTDALTKMVVGKKTPLKRLESTGSQASGSQASGTHEPLQVQQANEQLAMEDAKENDKLLIQAEEAARSNAAIICKAKKIVKALPPTVLAKMHCKHLDELKVAMEQHTAQLESITMNGTMPDDSGLVSMAILKDLLQESWANTKDLSKACIMAQALMPKRVQEKRPSTRA